MSEQDQLTFWTKALNLPGFRVVAERGRTSNGTLRFTIAPTTNIAPCPRCGRNCDTIHQQKDSAPCKDLPIANQSVELVVRTTQLNCKCCGTYFTPAHPDLADGVHATQRLLETAAQMIRFSDISNVAQFYGLAESNLTRWYYAYVERQQQLPIANLKPIRSLGIDELSQKRYREFVAVFVDHTNQRVLNLLKSREKAIILKYLREGKESGLLACVEEVTCDMWEGYKNAALETFGARILVTIDRFHVMKNFQEQLTEARREIQRALGAVAAKELKGTRWLWLTNQDNLTMDQVTEMQQLKQRFPLLGQLADQRESLRDIFEDKTISSAACGKERLLAWMEQAQQLNLKGLNGFCKTLTNWLDDIANYFVNRSSNGRTEGFNRGLRSILWHSFGMDNFEHFRLRVLDRFGRPPS